MKRSGTGLGLGNEKLDSKPCLGRPLQDLRCSFIPSRSSPERLSLSMEKTISALDGVGDEVKILLELLERAAEMSGECTVRLAARLFQHHALFYFPHSNSLCENVW